MRIFAAGGMRVLLPCFIAAAFVVPGWQGAPRPLAAQDGRRELQESQARLEQIREEREELQREMTRLRTRVRDASRELANLERQVETSMALLRELDFQTETLMADVDSTTRELEVAGSRLSERQRVLRQRLRSIYKDGPLHAARVLLSARSFGDLLNRYKYIHLITLSDQMLLDEVTRLESDLRSKEQQLNRNLEEIEALREEKTREVARLGQLESRAKTTLSGYRRQEQQAQTRLEQLERDEARLSSTIADMERLRLESERRRVVAGGPPEGEALTTRALGSLAWPVDGRVLYRFGPERKPSGVVLRWNGIGIGAPVGTPVRAVEEGTVVLAGPFEGYGPSVFVSHGGGYYTLYLYLRTLRVRAGERVAAGDVVGTVGGERTPEGPHMEFQVRVPVRGGVPEAVDPLTWLRSRAQ